MLHKKCIAFTQNIHSWTRKLMKLIGSSIGSSALARRWSVFRRCVGLFRNIARFWPFLVHVSITLAQTRTYQSSAKANTATVWIKGQASLSSNVLSSALSTTLRDQAVTIADINNSRLIIITYTSRASRVCRSAVSSRHPFLSGQCWYGGADLSDQTGRQGRLHTDTLLCEGKCPQQDVNRCLRYTGWFTMNVNFKRVIIWVYSVTSHLKYISYPNTLISFADRSLTDILYVPYCSC